MWLQELVCGEGRCGAEHKVPCGGDEEGSGGCGGAAGPLLRGNGLIWVLMAVSSFRRARLCFTHHDYVIKLRLFPHSSRPKHLHIFFNVTAPLWQHSAAYHLSNVDSALIHVFPELHLPSVPYKKQYSSPSHTQVAAHSRKIVLLP